MNFFRNLKFGPKLISSFIFISIMSGFFAYVGSQLVFRELQNDSLPNLQIVTQTTTGARQVQAEVLQFIATGEETRIWELAEAITNLNTLTTQLSQSSSNLEARELFDDLAASSQNVATLAEEILQSHVQTLAALEALKETEDQAEQTFNNVNILINEEIAANIQNNNIDELENDAIASKTLTAQFIQVAQRLQRQALEFVADGEPEILQEYAESAQLLQNVQGDLESLLEEDEPGEVEIQAQINDISAQLLSTTQSILDSHANTLTFLEQFEAVEVELNEAITTAESFVSEDMQASLLSTGRNSLIGTIFTVLFSLIFALFLANVIIKPITDLEQAARRMQSGDLAVQANVSSNDEIGSLSATFNEMAGRLRTMVSSLEQRTGALVTNTQILSSSLDERELVKTVVEQIQATFNYYHVHIYLLDETKERLVLAAGTGEAGHRMLINHHQINRGQGLVGKAATNTSVWVQDISQSQEWLPNPLLPDTRAEIAVPIVIGSQVLGVLDVQHNVANGLSEDDVDLLQSIANQVAIALYNARQYKEAQQRTREIQESTNFLNSVLENLPNMLFVKDAEDLRFVRWNKAGEDLTGFSRDDVLGKNDYDFFPKEEADFFTAKDREVLSEGVLVDIPEEPIQTLYHGTRILHTRKVPLMGADGLARYLLGISEDITEQKLIEAQLGSRVQQLNLLSEIGRKAEETNSIPHFLQWVSERLITAVRHNDVAVAAITVDDKIYGDERAVNLTRQIVEGLRVGGEIIGRIYIAYDGDYDFGDEESALLGSVGQRVASYIETQRLVERTRLLASIVENHPDFIGIGSLAGQTLYVNPAGLQMAGYPADYDIEGLNASHFYPPEDATKLFEEGIPAVLQSGYWSDEAHLLRADGSILPVEETLGVNYDVNGQPISFSITMRDITERKQTAEALAKQAKELQIVTEVGTAAAAAEDVLKLLQTVVDLTQSGFDLYHTQIFLVDSAGDALQMAAGSGEVGQYLLHEKPIISLRSVQSLMAQAARTRQAIVAGDVRDVFGYLSHPLLADTRSEIAVPLIAGDELLGVLDVQANEPGYFSIEDLPVYTTLATQVAVALQNVRQYEETQRALEDVQTLQRTISREGWQTFMMAQKRPIRGYRAAQNKVETIPDDAEETADLTTPVTILGQTIGGLAIRGAVSAENKTLLEAISQQVGQALERSRLAEQTQMALSETEQQALRLAQLNEMAAAISAAATLDEVLQATAQRTNAIFKGDWVSLTLLDQTRQLLQVYQLDSTAGAIDTGTTLPLENSASGQAVRENRLITVNNLAQSPYSEQQKLYEAGLLSSMIAPLSTRSGVIGTLNITSNNQAAFDQNDENLLLQVASLIATTIESRRLFIEVEERAEELAVINQVAQAVSQQLEPNQLLATILNSVRQVMEVDGFLVNTYDPATNILSYLIVYDHNQYYQIAPAPLNLNSQSYQVIHTGQSILNRYTPEELEAIRQQSPAIVGKSDAYPASSMFVPLKIGQQVKGVISVQSYGFNKYTEADMAVLTGIANHVAVALENARLFSEAQRRADRERLVNEITRKIQGTTSMESALQTAVRELGTALQAKNAQVALHPSQKEDSIPPQTNGPTPQIVTAD